MEIMAKYPLVTAAAFMMDCSGGTIFTGAATLERAYERSEFAADTLRTAEAELAKLTGEQLEYFALGGPDSGEPFTGVGGPLDLEVLQTANRVLEQLYNEA